MNRRMYSVLCDNFNKQKSEDHYELLKENLKNYDPVYLERAINKIVSEDKFFPSVARLKEVVEMVSSEPLTKEEKLKRWEKEGIVPECISKEPQEEQIQDEELKELQNEWNLLFG